MKYAISLVSLLLNCPGSGSSTTEVGLAPGSNQPERPCEVAARARSRVVELRADGRLDRSLRTLAHADELCPGDAKESAAARAEITAELQSTKSPDALIALAEQAKTPAEAQRSYDRALAVIERAGGRVEVGTVVDSFEPSPSDDLELDRDGGRLAILHGNEVSIRDRRVGYGETRRILRDASIVTAAFSGADTFAVATDDGETTLWNLASGEQLQTIRTSGWHAQLGFSSDGRMLAATTHPEGKLVVFDTANGNVLQRLDGSGGFAFLPDGRSIVVVNGNVLQAHDLTSGKPLWSVDGGNVMSSEGRMSVSKDGQRIRFAAGYAHIASVDVKSKKREDLVWESGVPDVPRVLALSSDGESVVLDHTTSTIPGGLHDVASRSPKRMPLDDTGAEAAAFSEDGRILAFQAGRKIHLVDVNGSNSIAVLESFYAKPGAVALSHGGRHLAIAGEDGAVRLLSAESDPTRLPLGSLESITLSADGKEIAGAREAPAREVVLFDARGTVEETFTGLPYAPTGLAFSPVDGRVLVSVGAPSGKAPPSSRFLEVPIPAQAWSRDRSRLALASPHEVQIGDQAGALLARVKPNKGEVRAVAFAPSNMLVMGLSNGMVASDRTLQLQADDESISALAFASEERMATSSGGAVRIWDLTDPRNAPKVYWLPDVRTIEASAGLFAWGTQDARIHLFHISTNRKATLVVTRDADGGAIHVGDAVELFGADPQSAAKGLVCRVAQHTYPFELCRERFLTPGLTRAILQGTALAPPP